MMEAGGSNLDDVDQRFSRTVINDDRVNAESAYGRCVPQHNIFISHSGKQKDFAEQLCKDLEAHNYSPFFDKRPDSLPKGEHFPSLIFKAAKECFLAIVLLSQDFLKSKWPMIELSTFVETRQRHGNVKILTMLLGSLCPEDLSDPTTINTWSHEYWSKLVESDKHLTTDDIHKWAIAVKALKPFNMILQCKYDGEVDLRSAIVSAVLRLIPPDVQCDLSHIQGKSHLYEKIMEVLFSNAATNVCNGATIVGVYGIAGSGKSTLCMILAHYLRAEFKGRVCHVDLGREDMSTLNLQIKVLEKLTPVSHEFIQKHIKAEEEGWTCLMKYIHREKVFLVLDSVSDKPESLEFAQKFVDKIKYHVDSKVLITSRTKYILHSRLGISESSCKHCPGLKATDALEIVLDHLNLNQQGAGLTKEQSNILKEIVKICTWEGHIHPMALKVLASQLERNPSYWSLSGLSLLESSEKEHPLLTPMEKYFGRLPDQQTKDMFMDIALCKPESISNIVDDVCPWLKETLHPSCRDLDSVRRKLNFLRAKSLLEVWSIDSDAVHIHDLHYQLARRMARLEDATDKKPSRFVYQLSGSVSPTEILGTRLAKRIERACLIGSSCTALAFDGCSSLKLLSLRSCNNLARLEIIGLGTLAVSLELSTCPLESLNLKDVINLRWLCLTSCQALVKLDANDCKSLVRVYISKCIQLKVLDLRNSIELELVSLSYNNSLKRVDLGSGNCLRCLTLWFCEKLSNVDMGESVCLSEFKKRGCPLLMNVHGCNKVSENVSCLVLTRWHRIHEEVITGLQGSKYLQVLDLWECPMSRIPDFRKCLRLRELKLTDVDVLLLQTDNRELVREYVDILCAADDELALPASLQEVIIVTCKNTVVKEICWKLHGLTSLLVLSMQNVRVSWKWELYRSNTKTDLKTQSSPPQLDLKILRSVLHETLDRSETTSSSEEGECIDEKTTSTDRDEVRTTDSIEMPGDVPNSGVNSKRSYELVVEPEMTSSSEDGECMDEETTSCTDREEVTTTDSIEMPGDVPNSGVQIAQINSKRSYELVVEPEMTSSSELEGECMDEKTTGTNSDEVMTTDSIEMPGDVPGSGDQIAQIISTRHELKMPGNTMKYLYHVIYWIHKFLEINDFCNIKKNFEDFWEAQHPGLPLNLEESKFVSEDWTRLVMSGELEKVHYSSPEYVFLETFQNFDT